MRSFTKFTIALGAVLLLSLTGCASEPAATSPTEFEQPDSGDEWWDETDTAASPVSYNTEVLVTGSEGQYYGDQPQLPASIFADGTIDLKIRYWVSDVPRAVLGGYVSTSDEGKTKGPEMDCARPAASTSASFESPTFECTVQFKDQDYDSGLYYAVLVTEPVSSADAKAEDLKMIAAIYTKAAK